MWYRLLEPDLNVMRALLSVDGESVLICLAGRGDGEDAGRVVRVSLDGTSEETTLFPYIDHDIVELPDGTIGAIVNVQEDGYTATGDAIYELAEDGSTTEIWNAWDALDPELYGDPNGDGPWTHANALDYVEEQDAYYISLVGIGTLVKVDRATGQTVWTMFGDPNEFTFPEGTTPVERQHQLDVQGNNMLIFDNGDATRGYSQAVEFEVDEENRVAEEVWSYIADPPLYVYSKGDVLRFDDGDTMIVWSSSGQIDNVTADGTVNWQLNTALGYGMTFAQVVPSMYAGQ